MTFKFDSILIGPFPPPVGGVSSSVDNFQKLLLRQNARLAVFNTSSGRLREDLYGKKGFRELFVFLSLFFRFIFFLYSCRRVRVANIFVVSNSAFVRDGLFLLVLKLIGKKVIVHFHSKVAGEMFLSPTLLPVLGFVLDRADVVLFLSESHKNFFSKYIKYSKLIVFENFVFSEDCPLSNGQGNRWLYVGRLSVMKGFFELLDAVDLCVNKFGFSGIVVDCLGLAESTEAEDIISRELEARRIQNNIILHGLVIGKSKSNFFKNSKGLIFPSRFENSPVVLKEAISSHFPVIASDIEANKLVLDRIGNQIYFGVGSAEDLARKIISLESDFELFDTLRSNAAAGFKHNENYALRVIEEVFDGF